MLLVHVLTKSRLGVACFSTDITGMGQVHVDLHVVLQPLSTLAFISAFATDNTAPNVAVLFNQSLNSFFEFGKIVNSFNLLGILGLLNLRLDQALELHLFPNVEELVELLLLDLHLPVVDEVKEEGHLQLGDRQGQRKGGVGVGGDQGGQVRGGGGQDEPVAGNLQMGIPMKARYD